MQDLVISGTVTNLPTYKSEDGAVYRWIELNGFRVTLPEAYNSPLPAMGQNVAIHCVPRNKNLQVLSWAAAPAASSR